MQSIDRAMNVIKVLVSNSSENWLSITELSQECDLPVSSMHRLLKAMSLHGLIQQDGQSKQYGLGNIWLEYGLRMYDKMDYISQIRPELERLMNKVEESVYLSQPIEMESLVIERIDSEKAKFGFMTSLAHEYLCILGLPIKRCSPICHIIKRKKSLMLFCRFKKSSILGYITRD